MLFVGTSIIHPSTEGVFLLCNILDLLIYSKNQFFARKIVVLSVLIELSKRKELKAMTKDEIRTAGRLAHDAYYEKGYDAGRKIADDLIGRMVLDGSNTPENISVFEDATGYSYK